MPRSPCAEWLQGTWGPVGLNNPSFPHTSHCKTSLDSSPGGIPMLEGTAEAGADSHHRPVSCGCLPAWEGSRAHSTPPAAYTQLAGGWVLWEPSPALQAQGVGAADPVQDTVKPELRINCVTFVQKYLGLEHNF